MTISPFGDASASTSSGLFGVNNSASSNFLGGHSSASNGQTSWNSGQSNSFGGMHLHDKREDSTSWISYSSPHTGQPGFLCREHRN